MNHVVKITKAFKNKIGDITFENLEEYLKRNNWLVVQYMPGERNKYLSRLNLEPNATEENSFLFNSNNLKIVFLREDIDLHEKTYCLLHEIAHIELGYTENITPSQERQVIQFAEHCQQQSNKKRKHITTGIISIVLLFIIIIAVVLSLSKCNEGILTRKGGSTSPRPETAVLNREYRDNVDLSNMVVITPNGEKYHRPDCYYVKNKENTATITQAEAIQLGKEPCSICEP